MKVLVTGANGFVGVWLCRYLKEQSLDVIAFVRSPGKNQELKKYGIEERVGDVTDLASLNKAMHGIDSVFHLAGVVAYKPSELKKMEEVNVQGTANVIDACLASGVRRLLHMSSVVAIGASFEPDTLNEESEFNVNHLNLGYFDTKREAERLVMLAVRTRGLDAVVVNPSTIYGPADAEKGSRGVQLKVAQGKFPFFPPGGVNIVSVHDVVRGMYLAWKKGRCGRRYILSGENLSIKQSFELIASCAGAKAPHIALSGPLLHKLGKFGDSLNQFGIKWPISSENAWTSSLYHWFDNKRAIEELGFTARPAKQAVEESVNWIKEHKLI